jgi:hypothetical protein
MSFTSDREDPRLTHGSDSEPGPQAPVYLVLSEEERAKGFIRPLRRAYVHRDGCGRLTTMGLSRYLHPDSYWLELAEEALKWSAPAIRAQERERLGVGDEA